jgi:hypothetical protein
MGVLPVQDTGWTLRHFSVASHLQINDVTIPTGGEAHHTLTGSYMWYDSACCP